MIPLNIEYEEIFPKIFIYKNLLQEHTEIYENTRRIEQYSNGRFLISKWIDWFTYGTYCNVKNKQEISNLITEVFSDTINKKDMSENIKLFLIENNLINNIQISNSIAISHYIAKNNVPLPDGSQITQPNIAKYNADVMPNYSRSDRLAMQFHTDYRLGEWYWPQNNFLLTCTTYINDDYNGGEIIFCVGDNYIPYKPKAGEILVFPSGSPLYPESPNRQPYFHATNSVRKNPKYFIRNYVTYPCEGEDLWFINLEKYGDKWYEVAKERSSGHNSMIAKYEDGKPFSVETYNINTKVIKYGSNLIPYLYDVDENEYLFYDKLYKYEDF